MKKQKIQLIVLIFLFLVVIGGYFAARFLTKTEQEKETDTQTYPITAVDSQSVTKISYQSEAYQYAFEKNDTTWNSIEEPSLTIDQTAVESLISCVTNLISEQKIEQVTDYGQYGLAAPKTSIVFQAGDQVTTLWIGDKNQMTGNYYIRLNEENTVYMVGDYVMTLFEKERNNFVEINDSTEENSEIEIGE